MKKDDDKKKVSRRGFLSRLGGAAAGLFGFSFVGREAERAENAARSRDLDLREADYYSPHDLAG